MRVTIIIKFGEISRFGQIRDGTLDGTIMRHGSKQKQEEREGGQPNLHPNAQTLKINSSMKRQLNTKPAMPSPFLTASQVGLGSPSSQVYRLMKMSAKIPSRSRETRPRTQKCCVREERKS